MVFEFKESCGIGEEGGDKGRGQGYGRRAKAEEEPFGPHQCSNTEESPLSRKQCKINSHRDHCPILASRDYLYVEVHLLSGLKITLPAFFSPCISALHVAFRKYYLYFFP